MQEACLPPLPFLRVFASSQRPRPSSDGASTKMHRQAGHLINLITYFDSMFSHLILDVAWTEEGLVGMTVLDTDRVQDPLNRIPVAFGVLRFCETL